MDQYKDYNPHSIKITVNTSMLFFIFWKSQYSCPVECNVFQYKKVSIKEGVHATWRSLALSQTVADNLQIITAKCIDIDRKRANQQVDRLKQWLNYEKSQQLSTSYAINRHSTCYRQAGRQHIAHNSTVRRHIQMIWCLLSTSTVQSANSTQNNNNNNNSI